MCMYIPRTDRSWHLQTLFPGSGRGYPGNPLQAIKAGGFVNRSRNDVLTAHMFLFQSLPHHWGD